MKCIVFGGGGFIGSSVVDRLLAEGCEVRVFERPGVKPYRVFQPNEAVEWISGDFSKQEEVATALEGVNTVVHLVSSSIPQSSLEDPIADLQTNVVSTIQLLEEMKRRSTPRILFISSGGTVYGIPRYIPIDEQHPTDPLVPYGITKLAIEKYLILYQRLYGIRAIILRVANPYGPRQRIDKAQGAVAAFLYRFRQELPIEIWGDGSVERDYLYIDDVADAFYRATYYQGTYSIFNIGSGQGTCLNELLSTIEDLAGRKIDRRYLSGRAFDVAKSALDCQLAYRELGWQPQTSLRDGLRLTIGK